MTMTKINKREEGLYGPSCKKCAAYPNSCRCLTNTAWANQDAAITLQKVYTRIHNAQDLNGTMEAPVQVLGRDLVEVLKNIEMCGKTVDQVLKYVADNFERI